MMIFYDFLWDIITNNLTRGQYLRTFKKSTRYEPYLGSIQNRKRRVYFSKLRLSDHDLINEKGRRLRLEK